LICHGTSCANIGSPIAFAAHLLDLQPKEMIVETAAILVVSEFEHRRAVYIPRSPIFGFPDIVTVEFVTLGPERSSVAVYTIPLRRIRFREKPQARRTMAIRITGGCTRMNASIKNPHW
jgi:hypothetical protein